MNYLDSSALVKLVRRESESPALRFFLDSSDTSVISSALTLVEVMRAARRHEPPSVASARAVIRTLELLPLSDAVLDLAASLDPTLLRSLDAIHLASAQFLGEALTAFVTYDARLAAAATTVGFEVVSPR